MIADVTGLSRARAGMQMIRAPENAPLPEGFREFLQPLHRRFTPLQQEFIEKEKEYIRRNIAGVNSRQAKGRRTKLARVERLERPVEDATSVGFRFDAARIGGRTFLRAKNLDAGYAPGTPIVRGVSFELLRGERLALLGEPEVEKRNQVVGIKATKTAILLRAR